MMNHELQQQAGKSRGRMPLAALAVLLGVLLVGAQLVLAWGAVNRETGPPLPSTVANGALCSVMLVNGQIYYGELAGANGRYISLRNVYYVQTLPSEPGGPPGNRLVSRRKADWHAPTLSSIPADKVLMIEAVGPDSKLAELVKQDGGMSPPK